MVQAVSKFYRTAFEHGLTRRFTFFAILCFSCPEIVFANNKDRQVKSAGRNEKASQVSKSPVRGSSRNTAKPSLDKKLTASGLYQKAKEYFNAGKFAEAIQYAAAAQRRTTASRLPTVVMAQSYYRLGNSARAAKLFRSVPLSELPRDAAVDYLFAMASVKRYADVVRVYRLIPPDHPYRDVARYYLGVSYLELKLYEKAGVALRSAKKIPASLKATRRQLLSQLRSLRQQRFQGPVSGGPNYYVIQSAPVIPPPSEVIQPAPLLPGGVPSKKPPPKEEPPKSGVLFVLIPSGEYGVNSTSKDFNGYNRTQSDSVTLNVGMDLGLKYLGEPRSFGGQPELELGFNPSQSSTDTRTSSSKLVASEDDPSNVQNQATRSDSKSERTKMAFSLAGLIPITEAVDVSASYDLANTTRKSTSKSESTDETFGGKISADFDAVDLTLNHSVSSSKTKGSSSKSGSATSKISLSHAGDLVTTSFTGSLLTNDPVSSGIKSQTDLELSFARELGDFDLDLGLAKVEKERLPLTAASTSLSETSIKGELTYSLDIGLSISLAASAIQIDSLPVAKDTTIVDGPDEVLASGSGLNYVLKVKYSPVSFVSASASYDYSDRALKVGNPDFKLKMLKENWSQISTYSMSISASYSF
jgi:hypothetical protein